MKFKNYLLVLVIFVLGIPSINAQNLRPFAPRFDQDLKGDILLIGNNILNRDGGSSTSEPNDPYNGSGQNGNRDMQFIDIDTDATTFSSSSATLDVPPISDGCYRIRYAGLYWSGILQQNNRTGIDQVKLKLPGSTTYTNLTGTIIHDDPTQPIGTDQNKVYACYYDITTLVQGLANPEGTYTVANVLASTGSNGGTGLSAGWSIFFVYEDPNLVSKSVVTFDGFSGIGGATTLDVPITGFRTIPAGPVRAKFAFSCLEGDQDITGDYLQINGNTISTADRAATNFFNSSITDIAGPMNAAGQRTPNSSNTLGYDAGIITNFNPTNNVIANNATSATVRLGSTRDVYFYFFNAFAVDIIEPNIVLTKQVQNTLGQDISNANVNLCQDLDYIIGFQNTGNDDVTNFTIRDVLPINVTFNPAGLTLPPGVTYVYTAATRTIVFTIPNNLVNVGDPRQEIRLRVRVVCVCTELDDACSNVIQNQAFATYQGVINTNQITDDPSLATFSACNLGSPSPTNFLVGLDDCNFTRTEVICGGSITLTAANGYQSYVWSGPGPITPVAGTNNQSVVVTVPGTYTVNNNINTSPCRSIVETINVVDFTAGLTNPVIPYADYIAICPNDGRQLPYIFLCGAGDAQLIQTNILGASSITWEQLNTASCAAVANPNCANENPACTWTNVGTGPNFNATVAGEYRVIIAFPNGCSRIFYFNVYQNVLAPTFTSRDIVCLTPGNITVNNVPPGYEYSLNAAGPWQSSNIFTINTAGVYTVYIRQVGVPGGCVFTLPNIPIRARNFTVTAVITQPLCSTNFGSINLTANDVYPQYTFTINQGATVIGTSGLINSNNYVFSSLNGGNYTYTVTTQDGCTTTVPFTINTIAPLSVTAALTRPLTCTDGEITVYPVGGTAPYNYIITGAISVTQGSPVIVAPVAGTYNIQVVDFNNCTVSTSIVVANNPPPVFTVSSTNILCYGANTGNISFNVTNANGYTLGYSITGAAPFGTNPNFTNLPPGTYTAIVQYTLGTAVCLSAPQTIIITEPAAALTASGGVAAVACASNGGNGIVRITNVQGGTPYPGPNFYQYNFGSGYQNLNQANLPPGTYTISVRDANLCEYFMTVTLDPIPADPTIAVGTPVFNCNGTATSTVTVNNGASSYTYTYSINPPLVPPHNPTSNVFQNVPCGNSVVTVNYTLVSPPTFSNLLNEDFGVGAPTTTSGINPAYCFENQSGVHPVGYTCNLDNFINDGEYGVTSRINPRFGPWNDPRDHTTNGTNPNGRFLCVNIGGTAGIGGIIYSKPITDIIPNQDIQVSLWAMNLIRSTSPTLGDPNLTIQLISNLGQPSETIVATTPVASPIVVPKSNNWEFYTLALNPGANTSLSFVIRSYSNVINGNDVVIDDINVFQLPVACLTTRNFPINIPCNQAFTAQITGHRDVSCAGANDATITVAAQNFNATNGFQVSMNNGVTWVTYLTSPQTIAVPTTYPGFVLIRYDATPANTACSFNLPQVIITPSPLVLSATATPATCIVGATITATASGGTPTYQYQLTNSGGTVIVAYQSSPIFSNIVPGSYIVVVRDFNLCTTSFPITIAAPPTPTATISAASDFCYDGVNGATLVVTASGGTAPYQYNINGGAFGTSNTFGPLTPGTHTINVRDAFGCTVTLPTQTINPQLTLSTVLTKDLDCTASPNAVITGTIAGGYPGYSYQVNVNGTGFGALTPVVGTSFTYTTATAGTYLFQVVDTRGCIAQSSTITINPLIPVSATHVVTNNTCFGGASGSVTITPSGGVAPYQINFNGLGFSSTFTYSNLAAGTYNYIVRDSKSCTFNGTVTITQPTQISYTHVINPIQCNLVGGYTLGSICVNGLTGGTAPYTYTLNDLTGGSVIPPHFDATGANFCFTGLDFGIYDLVVTDANGCTVVHSNLIMSNPPSDLTFIVTPTIPSCAAGATVSVTVVGLPSTYEFGIMNLPPPIYSSSFIPANNPPFTHIFTGLTPGVIYTFVVRDTATGCYYFETMTAPTPTNSTLVPTLNPRNVTCRGAADGSISGSLSGFGAGATSITYTINYSPSGVSTGITGTIAGPPFNFTNLGPLDVGNYTIYFNEVNGANAGCGVTSTAFTISQSAVNLTATVTTTNDNCNINAGQIAVNPSGGTGPYTYQYLACGSPAPIATSPGWVATNPFNGESGCYEVYVKDANDCIRMIPATINLDPTPVIAATLVNACAAEGAFSINVSLTTPGVGPYSFSIDGGAYQAQTPPFTITGLSSGAHTVQVRDRNGCGNIVNVNILAPIVGAGTFTTQPTCRDANGQITVTATGGSGTYNYSIVPNTGITLAGNVFSNVAPGSYTVTITDPITTCTRNVSVILAIPADPTFTAVSTPPSCNGGTNGTIVVSLTGSNVDPTYTYQITAPIAVGPQTSNTFTNLPAGAYTIQVNSGRGCFEAQVFNVTQPPVVNVPAPSVTQFACSAGTNTNNLATITVNGVTGGSGTYPIYEFVLGGTVLQSGSSNIFNTANVAGGTYTVNVYDNNGCLGSTTAVINPYISISNPVVTVVNPITCTTLENIRVTVTTTGGVAPVYSYTINSIPAGFTQTNNTGIFNGLPIGDYIITITNPVTNCSLDIIHYVFDPNTFDLNASLITDVSCVGGNNGSVNLTFVDNQLAPTNDAGPFTYVVTNTTTPLVIAGSSPTAGPTLISNLTAGVYSATATLINSPNCTVTTNFTITEPSAALTLSTTSTPITCIPGNDGSITATATGGWAGGYEYELVLGGVPIYAYSSTSVFTGLGAGNYTVNVRDSKGCIVSTNVVLSIPAPIATTITNSPSVACNGDTTATINIAYPTGGQGSNYSYVITRTSPLPSIVSGPFAPIPLGGEVINNLGAGNYTITITDGFNCQYTSPNVIITEPTIVTANLSMSVTPTCAADTVLTLTATGGTPPYAYSTAIGGPYSAATFNPSVNINIPANTTGGFSYFVRDANGCISNVSNTVTIDPITPLALNIVDSDTFINCNGDSTGFISVNANGGLGSYVYTITPFPAGATQTNVGPVVTFGNLPAGSYDVNVTSGNCTIAPTTVVINQQSVATTHTPSQVDVLCFGLSTGSITVTSAGVSGPYQYSISTLPAQTFDSVGDQFTFSNLAAGTYFIYCQDSNGCRTTLTVTINQPLTAVGGSVTNIIDEACAEDNFASFQINAVGGTPPYTVSYTSTSTVTPSGSAVLGAGVTTHVFSGLDGGIYSVMITDANLCTWDNQIQIDGGALFNPDTIATPECENNVSGVSIEVVNLSNTPSLDFTPLSDYTFELDNNGTPQSSNIFTSWAATNTLTVGTHTIEVVHVPTGCTHVTPSFVITNADVDPLQWVSLQQVFLNTIVATVQGGTAPYTYEFVEPNGSSHDSNTNLPNTYIYTYSGIYTVNVTDSTGCTITQTIPVTFIPIFIPNVFTPGSGEGWSPQNKENYPNLVTRIYDRYGRLVKTLLVNDTWDGKYEGKELPSGDYWYVVKIDGKDDEEYVGHFTLYR